MKKEPKKGILLAFGELFLKSEGVRKLFQKRLAENLSFYLKKERLDFKLYSFRERIFVETAQLRKAREVIKRVFGIAWLAEAFYFPEATTKEFSEFVGRNYRLWIKNGETFALNVRKEGAGISESRSELIDKIAAEIKRKVNLSSPRREIFVEARKGGWFLYFKKIKGAGGLPAGSGGKALSLVSGGIDSPVASHLVAKRGLENVWLHFHSFPLVSRKSIDKIEELAKIFLKYQPRLKVIFVPFQKAQMEVKTKTPAKYRILLYRRLMMKIAQTLAIREDCKALVTGESLGQVSSQTLPNIAIIEEGIKIPVLRPLLGNDKQEIMDIAKLMGTFDISIKPQEDCCTLFVPKRQTAGGNIAVIKQLEKKINKQKIVKEILSEAQSVRY